MQENSFKVKLIYLFSRIKHFKVICFVNNIFGLWQSKDEKIIARQINMLDLSDVILAPNQNAINKYQKYGISAEKMISVGCWDFLMSKVVHRQTTDIYLVAYAGNLSSWKCKFLEDLVKYTSVMSPISFRLLGTGIDKQLLKHLPTAIQYLGLCTNDQVAEYISDCGWGLVWDGSTLAGGGSSSGQYTNITTHINTLCTLQSGFLLLCGKVVA